ncbi:autotransporter outer membrane beta-barrel domain-containing protein [Salmonella enterica]|nr:autotransporter outer membrane beta-barrel domain-containing protein [Salmonella enterica]
MRPETKPLIIAAAISAILSGSANATYTRTVESGTTIDGEILDSINAHQAVFGTANNTTIIKGGQYIQSGGAANDTVITGGEQWIVYGATSNRTTISGGKIQVNGEASDIIATGGELVINAGDNGTVDPNTGGKINSATLSNGALLENRFGIDNNTIVNSGGILQTGTLTDIGWKDTGISNNATINAGGLQTIDNGGTSNGSTINKGGELIVLYDTHTQSGWDTTGLQYGTANATTVYGAMANNGGIDNNTVIKAGGQYTAKGSLTDNQKARSKSTFIESGGSAMLDENSLAENWTIQGAVSLQNSTAIISDSTVDGGELLIERGTALGTTVNSGLMNNQGGNDKDTIVNAGGNYYMSGAGATSSNLTINSGAIVNIDMGTIIGVTINGEISISHHPLPDSTPVLEGDVSINDTGTLTINPDVKTSDANVVINNSGTVFLNNNQHTSSDNYDFQLNTLTMNGGNVVFNSSAGYSTLTFDSLNGTGSFYMNTSIADLHGDFLNVTGEANGNFDVYISDSGKSPDSNDSLQIIQTGGGNAAFSLANTGGVVDMGTYEYHLIANGNNGWALTPDSVTPTPPDDGGDVTPTPPDDGGDVIPTPPDDDGDVIPTPPDDGGDVTPTPPDEDDDVTPTPPVPVTPTITPSTAAVLSMATIDPLVFQAEMNSIRHRLNETRSFSHDTNVWSDVYNTRNNASTSAGAGFDQTLTGLTIGADKSDRSGNGVVTRGVFFSYSHSDVNFDRGGDGNVDSYSVGAYASYLHDNGFYLDGILKANHFENDVNGRMTGGGAANGYYDTNGTGAHIQGGKYFHFGETYIAPFAAVTAFTTDNSDYTLSNGMQAHVGNERSVLIEAGVNVGHKFVLKNGTTLQPYVGAAVTQEFIDDNKVDVNHDGHFTNDLSGTRGVYQTGLRAQVTPNLTAHVSASYAQGANIESPWIANAGVAWSF